MLHSGILGKFILLSWMLCEGECHNRRGAPKEFFCKKNFFGAPRRLWHLRMGAGMAVRCFLRNRMVLCLEQHSGLLKQAYATLWILLDLLFSFVFQKGAAFGFVPQK